MHFKYESRPFMLMLFIIYILQISIVIILTVLQTLEAIAQHIKLNHIAVVFSLYILYTFTSMAW